MAVNTITISGRITHDLELRATQKGDGFLTFSLATQRPSNYEETLFINCVSFGRTAEYISKYASKGSQITVQGQFDIYEFNKKRHHQIIVRDVEIYFERQETMAEKETRVHSELEKDEDLPF